MRHSSLEQTWLPAALLATLTLLVGALQSFGNEPQLQWRRAQTPSPSASSPSPARTRLRATQPRDSRGYNVIQVGHNDPFDEGQGRWNSSNDSTPAGNATLKSVIVYRGDAHPDDSANDFDSNDSDATGGYAPVQHLAQNPFEDDEQLLRDLAQPFGTTEPEEAPGPELDEPNEIGELPEPTEPMIPKAEDDLLPDIDFQVPQDNTDHEPARDPFDHRGEPDTMEAPTEREPTDRETDARRGRDRKRAEALAEAQTKAQETCSVELAELQQSRIASIDLSIAVTGQAGRDFPFECAIDNGSLYPGRCWPEATYMWKAAANCHKPLYFEQHHLERYGHSWGPCLQPIVSGAHFFTRLPVLPYCMGLKTPNECVYPLGHYRPGNCAPYMVDPIPFTWRAVLFQAGATVGVVGVLP